MGWLKCYVPNSAALAVESGFDTSAMLFRVWSSFALAVKAAAFRGVIAGITGSISPMAHMAFLFNNRLNILFHLSTRHIKSQLSD